MLTWLSFTHIAFICHWWVSWHFAFFTSNVFHKIFIHYYILYSRLLKNAVSLHQRPNFFPRKSRRWFLTPAPPKAKNSSCPMWRRWQDSNLQVLSDTGFFSIPHQSGGYRTRTYKGFLPLVFETSALPIRITHRFGEGRSQRISHSATSPFSKNAPKGGHFCKKHYYFW